MQGARRGSERAELGDRHQSAQLVEIEFSHCNTSCSVEFRFAESRVHDIQLYQSIRKLQPAVFIFTIGARMSASVFIDGDQGTTGLEIRARLSGRRDIDLITLPEALRKDSAARAAAINECDVAVLCLPDEAARQAVASIRNPRVRVIDASSAHRTDARWVYGFPEMAPRQSSRIAEAVRVSNPGCYPTGAVALLRPLVEAGCLHADAGV